MSKDNPPLYSMTGFGRGQDDWGQHRVTVEIAAVNSRFLDLSFYAPSGLSGLEASSRRVLARALQRGKVRCSVRVAGTGGGGTPLMLRESSIREYLKLYAEIKQSYGLEGTLTAEALLFAPEVVSPLELDTADEEFGHWFERLLSRALEAMLKMRTEEGEFLRKDLLSHVARMEELASKIQTLAPRVKDALRARLLDRLRELRSDLEFPEERILTEVALLAERSDISEEVARLESHIQQFRDALKEGGAVGRRLDFLTQELNREINTIGAKAADVEIGAAVVEFKESLAKAREQAQNVE